MVFTSSEKTPENLAGTVERATNPMIPMKTASRGAMTVTKTRAASERGCLKTTSNISPLFEWFTRARIKQRRFRIKLSMSFNSHFLEFRYLYYFAPRFGEKYIRPKYSSPKDAQLRTLGRPNVRERLRAEAEASTEAEKPRRPPAVSFRKIKECLVTFVFMYRPIGTCTSLV